MLIINKDASRDVLLRKLLARGKKMEKRIIEIEKKQAERFPHLIERLEFLENRQRPEIYNQNMVKNNQRNFGAKK
jgi:hypothetical protein